MRNYRQRSIVLARVAFFRPNVNAGEFAVDRWRINEQCRNCFHSSALPESNGQGKSLSPNYARTSFAHSQESLPVNFGRYTDPSGSTIEKREIHCLRKSVMISELSRSNATLAIQKTWSGRLPTFVVMRLPHNERQPSTSASRQTARNRSQ